MAFEIGERVSSFFTGPGTVIGSLERDEDKVLVQLVQFDNPALGTKLREVGKMSSLEPGEVKAKDRKKIQKEGGDGSEA